MLGWQALPVSLRAVIAVTGAAALFAGGAFVSGVVRNPREPAEPTEASAAAPAPTPEAQIALPLAVHDIGPEDVSLPQGMGAGPEASVDPITVAVMGAVQAPGLHNVAPDNRVQDLIDLARGISPEADLSDINLAAHLMDGSTLTIPEQPLRGLQGDGLVMRRGESAADLNPPEYTRSGWRPRAPAGAAGNTAGPGQAVALPADGRIDLNRASATELETLPGIGPKTAEKIINYRALTPFRSVDDLMNVHGIGEKKLEAVRALVCVK